MIAVAVSVVAAMLIMAIARMLLRPRWEYLAPYFPTVLLHRWSLGTLSLVALYLFFCVPFLVIGEYSVAAAGFGIATLIIFCFGRDIVEWIVSDLREHRSEGRGLLRHGDDCVVHAHYHHDHGKAEGKWNN